MDRRRLPTHKFRNNLNPPSVPYHGAEVYFILNVGFCIGPKAVDDEHCQICSRAVKEWFLRLTVEDNAGLRETALICANCGVKLRLASERTRDLQIDPWIHEAVANVLRGKSR